MRETSWLVEERLASEEGFCAMELICQSVRRWNRPCTKRCNVIMNFKGKLAHFNMEIAHVAVGEEGIFSSKSLVTVVHLEWLTFVSLPAISHHFPHTLRWWIDSCHPHAKSLLHTSENYEGKWRDENETADVISVQYWTFQLQKRKGDELLTVLHAVELPCCPSYLLFRLIASFGMLA